MPRHDHVHRTFPLHDQGSQTLAHKRTTPIKRLLAACIFILLSGHPSRAWNEPDSFKFYKWGMTWNEVKEAYKADLEKLLGSVKSDSFIERQMDKFKLIPVYTDGIGGVRVTIFLGFLPVGTITDESRLGGLTISFKSDSYESMKEMFIERYGRPTSVKTEQYNTKGGVQAVNEILVWQGEKASVALERFSTVITDGSAVIGTNVWRDEQERSRKQKLKDAAKTF